MSISRAEKGKDTGAVKPVRLRLLEAAKNSLLSSGYAALSTRAVADLAQTQLSQIHYHFGSKQGLVLALFEHQNQKLLERQSATFGAATPLSTRWAQACDFLDEDLKSGYVRVLQEIIAAGFSDEQLAEAARAALAGWFKLLNELAAEASELLGQRGMFRPEYFACLAGLAFIGAESLILINMDLPIRSALRSVGENIYDVEQSMNLRASHAT